MTFCYWFRSTLLRPIISFHPPPSPPLLLQSLPQPRMTPPPPPPPPPRAPLIQVGPWLNDQSAHVPRPPSSHPPPIHPPAWLPGWQLLIDLLSPPYWSALLIIAGQVFMHPSSHLLSLLRRHLSDLEGPLPSQIREAEPNITSDLPLYPPP